MKLLVIGRSGQVATALQERGAAHGIEVVALGRPAVDLTQPDTLRQAIATVAPDAVVNAAAYTAVDAAESDEATAHALNATGAGALATCCARAKVALAHLSTDYVFDGTLDRPYTEEDPVNPQSAYGRTKAAGEVLVRDSGARALILRTAWVYAPFGKNFVRTMLRLAGERDTLRVVADQHGNPTSALDIADALIALSHQREAWPESGGTLHLAGTGETAWHGFAEAIVRWAGLQVTVEPITSEEFPTPARRPKNSRLRTEVLATKYGIELPHWTESAHETVLRLTAQRP